MTDLDKAKEILYSAGYTCVMCRGDAVYTSEHRGIKPLVAWLEGGERLRDFCAADRVVGKATAFLYVLLGVKAIYTHVISRSALQVLTEYGITVEFDALADNIINRQGNGICPFEAAVLDVVEPAAAYKIIRNMMNEMNIII